MLLFLLQALKIKQLVLVRVVCPLTSMCCYVSWGLGRSFTSHGPICCCLTSKSSCCRAFGWSFSSSILDIEISWFLVVRSLKMEGDEVQFQDQTWRNYLHQSLGYQDIMQMRYIIESMLQHICTYNLTYTCLLMVFIVFDSIVVYIITSIYIVSLHINIFCGSQIPRRYQRGFLHFRRGFRIGAKKSGSGLAGGCGDRPPEKEFGKCGKGLGGIATKCLIHHNTYMCHCKEESIQ